MASLQTRLGSPPGRANPHSSASLRSSLRLVLIAASIPVLLFAGWTVYRAAERGREDARAAAAATADRVAERVRAEMMAQIQVAQTLSLSATLDQPDLAAFYREAARLKDARQLWFTVELDDLQGRQVVNLLRPLGAALGPTADRPSFDEAVRLREPVVGGIGPIGPISGQKLVAVRVPVEREGRLRGILTVAFDPSAISSILRGAGIPEGWIGAVVDEAGNIVARSVAENETLGRPANPDLRETIRRQENGRYPARSLEGVDLEVVFRSIAGIGEWSVHLGAPRHALEAPVQRSLLVLGIGILASLALAIGVSVLTSRELARQASLEKERAEAALNASERQGALAIQAADLGTWRWNPRSDLFNGSARARDLLRLENTAGTARGWRPETFWSAAGAADRGRIGKAIRAAIDGQESFELDISLSDGAGERWIRVRGRSLTEAETVVIGVMADITLRKRAEADRRVLLQRMADSQEQAQARIARELHDQVGQTVTGLSLGLKSIEHLLRDVTSGDGPARRRIDEAQDKVRWLQGLANTVGREIHQAAADLRPTALDDLGLSRALRAHMEGWSRRFGVAIDFQAVGPETPRLPAEIETAIYRVAQEALTNVMKHARARQVSTVLERRAREVRLVIEDDGVGFDPEATGEDARARLGISGMRERLGLVGGRLRIESTRGGGASIFIRVPLAGDRDRTGVTEAER